MIKTYEYRVPLEESNADLVMAGLSGHAANLARIRRYLLGTTLKIDGAWLHIELRLTDIDQWRIAMHARKTIVALCVRAKLPYRRIEVYQVLEEPNARSFMLGEGRSPRARRPRSCEPAPPND